MPEMINRNNNKSHDISESCIGETGQYGGIKKQHKLFPIIDLNEVSPVSTETLHWLNVAVLQKHVMTVLC